MFTEIINGQCRNWLDLVGFNFVDLLLVYNTSTAYINDSSQSNV